MARNPNTRDDVARPQDAKPRVRRADDQICLGQRNDAAPSNHASPQKTGRQPSALFSSQKSQAVKPFLVCCCPLCFLCLSTRFISKKEQAREEQQLQQGNKEGKAAAAKAASALMTHRPEFSASSRSSKYSSSSSKCSSKCSSSSSSSKCRAAAAANAEQQCSSSKCSRHDPHRP